MAEGLQVDSSVWCKAISPERDRLQSRLLVGVMLPLLAVLCGLRWQAVWRNASTSPERHVAIASLGVSLTFALLVWLLRSATPLGAVSGGIVCELLELTTRSPSLLHTGLTPLVVLFLMTSLATRAGRHKKTALGLAEPKTGRRAAQVLANLGFAGLAAFFFNLGVPAGSGLDLNLYPYFPGWPGLPIALGAILAALCEATADTVSSEMGQAFGGAPLLLPSFRSVPAGTDGAVSATGTLSGIGAAALVAAAGCWALPLSTTMVLIAWSAGSLGFLFDSLLGATLERKGLLGNDLVNFASTAFAGALCVAIVAVYGLLRH